MKKYIFALSVAILALSFAGIKADDYKVKDTKTVVSKTTEEKVPVGMKKCVVGDKTVMVAADVACPVDVKDVKEGVKVTPKPVDVKSDFQKDYKKDVKDVKDVKDNMDK